MRKILVLFALIFVLAKANAQELNCTIQINHQQVQGANVQVFQSMQKDMYEFINNRKWTDNVFSNDERIDCSITLNVSAVTGSSRYTATIQVQSRRPVYNATYYSTIFNFQEKKEDFTFDYIEHQPLEFNENSYTTNITSVLAFYAYVLIGLDYDTFSPGGGSPYFQKAQNIVSNAQVSSEPGWKAVESLRNRYWLAENLTNEGYSELHTFMYEYHRLGLDVMNEKADAGRAVVAKTLENLMSVNRKKPSLFFINLLMTIKSDEFINIFSESFPSEVAQVSNILKEIDPANVSKYEKIIK